MANFIAKLPWVDDGLVDAERSIIDELLYIAVRDDEVARETVGQPFLRNSYETHDLHLVNAINSLLHDNAMDHLRRSNIWRNHGITDEWAPAVAAVAATASADAHREYLDENWLTLGDHQIPTAHNPNLRLSIVRKAGDAVRPDTVEIIQSAIAGIETVMGVPLPTDHVIIIFDARAVTGGFQGVNHGFAIASKPDTEDKSRERRFSHVAHEAAHYWWRGNEDWLDEGLADTIAATASSTRGYNVAAQPNQRKDCEARNISEIGDAAHVYRGRFYCNYYLGQRLFRSLQDTMTKRDFQTSLRTLYRISSSKQQDDFRYEPGIAEVHQAFPEHTDKINSYWSGNVNAPETWDPHDRLNFTSHNVVRWTQKPTYRNGVVSFSGTLAVSASLAHQTIQDAREGGYGNFTIQNSSGNSLGSILPPLTGRSYWNLTNPADVVASTYEIHEKTFTIAFHWPSAAGDFRDKHITIWGYNNAQRTPSIGRHVDSLGQSMIR